MATAGLVYAGIGLVAGALLGWLAHEAVPSRSSEQQRGKKSSKGRGSFADDRSYTKLVLCVRTDIKMGAGKIGGGDHAHAHMPLE
jgi:hypothetical protein